MQTATNTATIEGARGRDAIRVLVADDEESVVDVLRALVGSDPSLHFIGAANDAERAIAMVLSERPDVVLLDVRMPGGGGPRAAREIAKRSPGTKIVALSAHDDPDTVIGMIGAGAHDYVPKGDTTDKILRTIHRAAGGSGRPRAKASHLTLVQPSSTRRDERAATIARAILGGAVTAEFGPVVDIHSRQIVGLEVQPRLATLPHRSYDSWCADALAVGVLSDLELAVFRAARTALPNLPEDVFLELELSPFTASEGSFRRSIHKTFASRIVLGFSPLVGGGGVTIGDVNFVDTLAGLRGRGVRVAATDAGTGLSALGHLISLGPELVRLDTTLTRTVDSSFANHSVVAAVVACAARLGARVIAPGVESEEQLAEMRSLGVDLVQGPHVGEPFHLSELSDRFPVEGS